MYKEDHATPFPTLKFAIEDKCGCWANLYGHKMVLVHYIPHWSMLYSHDFLTKIKTCATAALSFNGKGRGVAWSSLYMYSFSLD